MKSLVMYELKTKTNINNEIKLHIKLKFICPDFYF